MKRPNLVAGTALVLAAAMLAACGGGDSGDEATDGASGGASDSAAASGDAPAGGTFVDGAQFTAVPPHIDPLLTSELDGAQVSTALYDGLTEFANEDGVPVVKPLIAEDWEVNDDATQFIFTIKDGLTFADASPLLPSNFKKAWDIAASPELAADYGYLFGLIKGSAELSDGTATELSGVVADDEAMTLTVDMNQPYADFPSVASHIIFSPMPDARFELEDQSTWEQEAMIGNGPFTMETAQTDQEIVIVRNDSWAGDVNGNTSAILDQVTFKIFADVDSAYAAFEAGETQSATIPGGRYAEATGQYSNTSETALLASYHWVYGMRDEDPLGGAANAKLRQAISLAIDRESINAAVYDGGRTVGTSITPPGIPGFEEDLCDFCGFDLDAAKAKLAEFQAEGGTIPEGIKLVFNAGAGHEDVAAIYQQNLEALGVTVTQEPLSSETYFDTLRDGGCPGLCRAGWFWDYPIYDNGMYDLFHVDSIGGNNLGWYDSADFNELVTTARQTVDTDEREQLFRDAENQLLNVDTAVIPTNWYSGDHVFAEGVEGYAQEPLGWVRFETISVTS